MKNVLLVALLICSSAHAARPYRGGVVATAHPYASEAALQMLNRGGNATDAAVAAAFVLAVVGPYHSGIGGGGFALVYDQKTAKTSVLDFREVAPKAATRDMYVKDGQVVPSLSTDGVLSVAVPGAAMGYLELLKRHGKLKPAVVLAPAIKLAKSGFWVTPKYQALATGRAECLRKDPEASRIFLRPGADGKTAEVPAIGALIKQPELGKTLEAMAKAGAKAFYAGRVAKAITQTVKDGGGVLTAEDLAAYKVRDREPLVGSYRGHAIHTMPPPSAGGLAVVQVLGMMELGGEVKYRDPLALHRYLEAVRRVYVDRAKYLGDPAFNQIPLQQLSSPAYIAELYKTVDDKKATPSQTLLKSEGGNTTLPPESKPEGSNTTLPPESEPEGSNTTLIPESRPDSKKNTTHISVLDRDGNAVAMTTTVNYGFGSCVVAKGTGVLLNNEMDDFAARPMTANVYGLVTGEANAIAPGKVPLSSMSPTFVFQVEDPTRIRIVVGSPGGPTIPTTVIQVISNVIDHGMDLTRAVGAGRIHHQYMPDSASVDRFGLEPATASALQSRGHALKRVDAWGDAEAVGEDPLTKLRYSASDPRNEGLGLGQD